MEQMRMRATPNRERLQRRGQDWRGGEIGEHEVIEVGWGESRRNSGKSKQVFVSWAQM